MLRSLKVKEKNKKRVKKLTRYTELVKGSLRRLAEIAKGTVLEGKTVVLGVGATQTMDRSNRKVKETPTLVATKNGLFVVEIRDTLTADVGQPEPTAAGKPQKDTVRKISWWVSASQKKVHPLKLFGDQRDSENYPGLGASRNDGELIRDTSYNIAEALINVHEGSNELPVGIDRVVEAMVADGDRTWRNVSKAFTQAREELDAYTREQKREAQKNLRTVEKNTGL